MIVQGKEIAEHVISDLKNKFDYSKTVCFVQFGNNPASAAFIKRKQKIAEALKIHTHVAHEPAPISTEWAIQKMREVLSKKYDGIVVQLPLPEGLDTHLILNMVPGHIDIDVLTDEMIAKCKEGTTLRLPPVAFAVQEILKYYKVSLENKRVVILGQGRLVGEPVTYWFRNQNVDLQTFDHMSVAVERDTALKNADIVVTGIGQPHFVKPERLKVGVVLIDAGTSEQAGRLVGDCDPACGEIASVFSTVPGGVGPITVAGLFANLTVE